MEMVKHNGCSETFEKICSYDLKKTKNRKSHYANICMSISMLAAGFSMSKIDKSLPSVGLISPVNTKLCENCQELKLFTIDLLKIEWKK